MWCHFLSFRVQFRFCSHWSELRKNERLYSNELFYYYLTTSYYLAVIRLSISILLFVCVHYYAFDDIIWKCNIQTRTRTDFVAFFDRIQLKKWLKWISINLNIFESIGTKLNWKLRCKENNWKFFACVQLMALNASCWNEKCRAGLNGIPIYIWTFYDASFSSSWSRIEQRDDVDPANGEPRDMNNLSKMCLLNTVQLGERNKKLWITNNSPRQHTVWIACVHVCASEWVFGYKNINVMHSMALIRGFTEKYLVVHFGLVNECVCVCQMDFVMLICHSNGHDSQSWKIQYKTGLMWALNICVCALRFACIFTTFYMYIVVKITATFSWHIHMHFVVTWFLFH